MLEAVTASLRQLYLFDTRPWRVGLSGGKDKALVEHLMFEAIRSIPADDHTRKSTFPAPMLTVFCDE